MTRVLLFGNCQAEALQRVLRVGLPERYELEVLINNPRSGEMPAVPEILERIERADVVVYQALGAGYGVLSATRIKERARPSQTVLAYPRIFNAGVSGLSLAHQGTRVIYGALGEEMIVGPLERGVPLSEVKRRYRSGELDLQLRRRLGESLAVMREREADTDVKVTNRIQSGYRERRLFLTHNHPATPLFVHVCEQIRSLAGLPIDMRRLRALRGYNVGALPLGLSPISPFDREAVGYEFPFDADWVEKGFEVIERVARAFAARRSAGTGGPARGNHLLPTDRRAPEGVG